MRLIPKHSAIPNWEGFQYQGHMALLIALEKFLYILDKDENEIDKYGLEIEGEEDFSILKNNKYISVHQVKAGGFDLTESDRFAFVITVLQNKDCKGYYHIINKHKKKINNYDFVSDTKFKIQDLINEINDILNNKIFIKENEHDEKISDKYFIMDDIFGSNKKASLLYLLKNNINKDNYNEEIVREVLCDIKTNLLWYESILDKDDCRIVHVYPTLYDDEQSVQEKSYEIIEKIMDIMCPNYYFVDNCYSRFLYTKLHDYLDESKENNYKNFDKKEDCILYFSEMKKILKTEHIKEFNNAKYQYYMLIGSIFKNFKKYWKKDFSGCNKSGCDSCKKISMCNLKRQMDLFEVLDKNDKLESAHNLLVITPEEGEANNLPNDKLIMFGYLDMVNKIESLNLKNNIFTTVDTDNNIYRLTLDDSLDLEDFAKKLNNELKELDDKSLAYEEDVFIVNDLNGEIAIGKENITVLDKEQLHELESAITLNDNRRTEQNNRYKVNDTCTKPKGITLMDRRSALKEFQNEKIDK